MESSKIDSEAQESKDPSIDEPASPAQELEQELEILKANIAIKDSLVESLKKKLSHYESKISEFRDFVKKMEAEVEAVRQRTERDKQKNIEKVKIDFLGSFLPILDNLNLSLQNMKDSDPSSEGIQLIRKQIEELLNKFGVEKLKSVDQTFDPEKHEALLTQPVEDDSKDGVVLEELRAGYAMNNQLIRSAQVIVGKVL